MNQDVLELPVIVFGSGASRQTRAWRLDVVFDAFGPAFGALDTGKQERADGDEESEAPQLPARRDSSRIQ